MGNDEINLTPAAPVLPGLIEDCSTRRQVMPCQVSACHRCRAFRQLHTGPLDAWLIGQQGDEQAACAGAEISDRIDQAVERMRDIVDNVGNVASGTQASGDVLIKLHGEAKNLLGQAQSLDGDVGKFIGQVLRKPEAHA